ncbi:MAG: hypothetical protein JNG85_13280 [Spirochaetaceae bacterium]|nr:hypothetical protein [Spirochaetaceae bacterium]
MVTVLASISLALLLVIAIELLVVIRELARLQPAARGEDDKKEGQTINVNVAALPVQDGSQLAAPLLKPLPGAAPVPAPESPAPGPEPAPEPEGEPEPEPPRRHAPAPAPAPAGAKATTSGQLAVKCPNCQAENSSFRSECFNCGTRL